ncbi:MAG: tape measure protein [Alteromonadaceae bacterium]|nr:tape measure protein [Alteromonadaceae bacterium]MBL4909077.1 tape measure protein [Alteromonadaceae bacterium]MBL4909143.1 tape measure protein [Alteromonadaceae bacterium]
MADFRIRVIVDPSQATAGTDKVRRGLTDVERSANKLRDTIARAFSFAAVSFGIQQILKLADAYVTLTNRVKVATNGAAFSGQILDRVFKIANNARAPVAQLAFLYQRISVASDELGASQEDVLKFVNATAQALAAQGGTTAEAAGALIQLSQALGNANIQAQEFNSLVDGAFPLVQAAARGIDEAGNSVSRLRGLIIKGRITNEQFFKAVLSQADSLEAAFARTTPTIAQGFVVLTNAMTQFIGEADSGLGITSLIAGSLLKLAFNLDTAAKAAEALGLFLGVGGLVKVLLLVKAGVIGLTVAIAANPLGALLIGALAVISVLIAFKDEIKFTENGVSTFTDVITVLMSRARIEIENFKAAFLNIGNFIGDQFGPIIGLLTPVFNEIKEFFADIEFSFAGIIIAAARTIDKIIGIFSGGIKVIASLFQTLPGIMKEVGINIANSLLESIGGVVNQIITKLNSIGDFVGLDPIDLISAPQLEAVTGATFLDVGKAAQEAFMKGFNRTQLEDLVRGLVEEVEKVGQARIANAPKTEAGVDLTETPFKRITIDPAVQGEIDSIEKRTAALKLNTREREVQQSVLALESKLRRELNVLEENALKFTLRQNQAQKDRTDILDRLNGTMSELAIRQATLNELLNTGSISASQFKNEMIALRLEQANLNIELGDATFVDGFLIGIESMLDAVRNFQAEAGMVFGEFFTSTSEGFATAAADAIIFGDSFQDAIGDVARKALRDLLAGIIQIGIQFVLNSALANTLGAASVASSVGQAAAVGSAWATPAALASLATLGTNSAAASTGILATVGLAEGLAVAGFANGGDVRGPGGPRSDSIPAMLSNGEFVVNAKSAARFRPLLQQINNPSSFQNGGNVGTGSSDTGRATPQNGPDGNGGIRIVNVIDPSMVEDFLTSSSGEKVLINTIERNASSLNQILRNN